MLLADLKLDAGTTRRTTGADSQVTFPTALYDLEDDPDQERPINSPKVEERMKGHISRLMRENDAPEEQFERLGLT